MYVLCLEPSIAPHYPYNKIQAPHPSQSLSLQPPLLHLFPTSSPCSLHSDHIVLYVSQLSRACLCRSLCPQSPLLPSHSGLSLNFREALYDYLHLKQLALHAVGSGAQGPTWHLAPLVVTVLRENQCSKRPAFGKLPDYLAFDKSAYAVLQRDDFERI